jgi:hypothetical protein
MQAGLTATLQAVLVIAAISSLPESASAASCTCSCVGWKQTESPVSYSTPMGSCSDLNGRSCTMTYKGINPDVRDAGLTVQGSLTGCTGR